MAAAKSAKQQAYLALHAPGKLLKVETPPAPPPPVPAVKRPYTKNAHVRRGQQTKLR